MSNLYGPLALTIGQPFNLQVGQDSVYVAVENDTLYDCYVFFGTAQPSTPVGGNVAPATGYHGVVRAGHTKALPTVNRGASSREQRLNSLGAFRGSVWLLLVNNGGQAQTGTQSARNALYVETYSPNDSAPIFSASVRESSLYQQQRMIAVPMASPVWAFGAWNSGAGANPAIQTTIPLTATNLANLVVNVYYYGAIISSQDIASGGMEFWIGVQPVNAGSALIGSPSVFAYGYVTANNANHTNTIWSDNPAIPLVARVTLPGTATAIAILLDKVSGTALTLDFRISIDIDGSNLNSLNDTGNAALFYGPSGGSPLF